MRLTATILLVLLVAAVGTAQFTDLAKHNAYDTKQAWTGPDSTMPWLTDQGVRTVWVTKDIDKDGKAEILATDYSNFGRVHVFEFSAPNTLELIWSSPRHTDGGGSTPRWVRDGDLDGDGNREIIFPRSNSDATDGEILVFEYAGSDNDFGTTPAIVLPRDLFVPSGTGNVRTNRELGEVYDFDGDGKDELITANRNNKVYIFGVQGDIPGFGSWQLEGGDPAVNPENGFSGGSWWHSMPADIDGDGQIEIVNHYWNFYGFWSIDPIGPDSYRYPTPGVDSATVPAAKTDYYHEYLLSVSIDGNSYLSGMVAADVDGDGKDELAGTVYPSEEPVLSLYGPYHFSTVLVSLAPTDTGVYVWRDSTQFGIIGQNLWELAAHHDNKPTHWCLTAYDFDEDGKDEVYVGGETEYALVSLVYNGSGSVLDQANYTKKLAYPGELSFYHEFVFWDSLGIKFDTTASENPFLTRLFAGSDLDGNGKKEIVMSYQSIADSLLYTWNRYDTTSIPNMYVTDSTKKVLNTSVINVRVVEYTGTTGFRDLPLSVVTPEDYVLEQNYPNPFNPSTTIRFTLPVDKKISLTVYDITGRAVRTLIGDQAYEKGSHSVSWDGRGDNGLPVASGQYIYTLRYGNFSTSQKMTLLK